MLGKFNKDLSRGYVYRSVDLERDYQDRKHGGYFHDRGHTIQDWLSFMYDKLEDAQELALHNEDELALEELRKIVALGVACMEIHGAPLRR